ncbi:MAG: hypothetical protein ACXABD_18770 [Candidatus Thorarchaeota archaeon]|jgi:Zn finger protein HypA/HybF involved in hydrogenase expression
MKKMDEEFWYDLMDEALNPKLSKEELKKLNSAEGATKCAQCNETLVQVSMNIKFCPVCEG